MFWQQNFSHKVEDSLGFLAHFLTPHIGPDPWSCHHLLSTSSFISIWYVYTVPDELRTLCSGINRVPTLQNAFYLVQACIWKQTLEKPYSSSSPAALLFIFTHTPPHTILFAVRKRFTTRQCCPRDPSVQKTTTTHTPTKQHKLIKHQSSHNSLSLTVTFQCLQLAILRKATSFWLQSFFCP